MSYPEEKIAKELRLGDGNLSYTESLKIAVGIRQNQLAERANELFVKAHAISGSDKHPSALEAIAIQLGFETKGLGGTSIVEALEGVKEGIKDVADILEEKFPQ